MHPAGLDIFDARHTLALPVGSDALFDVPRSQQAWDANAELVLRRKRNEVRVWPYVRTPGLADNQRRLGDLRLECQVFVALANTVFLTGDWCSFFKDRDTSWGNDDVVDLAFVAPEGAAP